MITLKAINAYRSSTTEDGQTFFERDIDKHSYDYYKELFKNELIKKQVKHFINYEATKEEADIVNMMYMGYNQREILERLKISRKTFLVCKEKLKNLFKGFITDASNI